MSLLRAYVDAWCRHDVAGVLATLSDDCVVIECNGPVYRGRPLVERWMREWLGAGGAVLGWEITTETAAGALLVAEWRFRCLWKGSEAAFDGISAAQVHNGRITRLREYATTAPLYDWTGRWRD